MGANTLIQQKDSAISVNTVSTNFFITIIADEISPFPAKGNGLISDVVKYDRLTVPSISIGTEFGSSVADMGDIDRNGTDDLAVGAPLDDSGGSNRGAVYILLMNADNTIKANTKIIHGSAGIDLAGIDLIDDSRFGTSVANIGDFDKNEINELAVGTIRGDIYILRLTRDGEIERFSTIGVADVNNPITLVGPNDQFGVSIANIGDIDGDRVDDLAVGAIRDNTRGNSSGAIHILFMNESGLTKKATNARINSLNDNLTLNAFDAFGSSIANLGDLDGDGINDIAVGAIGDDKSSGNTNEGVVHVLLLNRDGSIKPTSFEIVDTDDDNIFNPDTQDFTGRSIANLGDINGDGINDIAVGAPGNNNAKEGSVFTILMRNAGDDLITTNGFLRTADNSHPDLDLSASDRFGTSIANIGDRNGDGVNDLAVGAPSDDSGGTDSGALYILHMDTETVIRAVTAEEENGRYEDGDTINIQVIFSEAVDVDATGGTPTLTLETRTGDNDTDAVYDSGSGSDTLTFEYTVVNGDEATDLDYVSTASLTLSDGTINAAAAPNSAALLTLPKPGTRGSLSSNKNISINRMAIENTRPRKIQTQPIPDQELTVNTPFTYTIPAGRFTDDQNDPLTYLPSTSLPDGLTLDARTGTFSGTPVTEQALIPYDYTVSDGTVSITDTINIIVNAAPTLSTMADKIYPPNSSVFLPTTLPSPSGGAKPITYTLSPELPDGLTFDDETRMITGITPATEQTGQYTYTAEDKNGALTVQKFTISIKPLILNQFYTVNIPITNLTLPEVPGGAAETGPYTYTLTPASFPEGLSYDEGTRTISGTPVEAPQTTRYTYTITNPAGTIVSVNFIITIIAETITTGYGGISNVARLNRNFTFTETQFGSSVANMGDINGDGIDDLAVGAQGLSLNIDTLSRLGSVVILLMNANNTIKSDVRITHSNDEAGFQLPENGSFGISVANIGDFDGDKINELAVGTTNEKMYILHLTSSGELDSFSTIDFNDINTILGNTDLDSDDRFGVSVANLGDIDGDGVIDLAVGAHRDDGTRGSVHILFMDKTETNRPILKAAVKLDTTDANLVNGDLFGISVANLGDLNQDGINDLAVGATNDNGQANNAGTVHIFYLNRDGSVKLGGFEIFDNVFKAEDKVGRSIANLGDINGDGINDIVVGATEVDSPPTDNTGAVFTIFMGRTRDQITTNDFFRIDTDSLGLNLSDGDRFGESIANIGDRNGDGINDLAVGAPGTRRGNFASEGTFYILYMDANTNIVNITSLAENGSYNTGTIDIQVIFSETVTVDATGGTPTLTLETRTGDNDTDAVYDGGSGSTTLTFTYMVLADDSATDLDYVNTASLTLNGGTINATDAPNSTALLTLPKPGTRGSLSSNKNIAINEPLPTNREPAIGQPIPAQVLTANIPFIVTIPTGAFTDADNDPLIYFFTSSQSPPTWLTLDADTGTFSGAPITQEALTQYTYTVSDGTDSITDTISITVKAALTLPTIADRNHSPGSGDQTFTIQLPTATGGTEAITYTLSPVIADGLFDTNTRRIIVTPTAEEKTRTYTYTAEDKNGALAAQTFTISIKPPELPNISDKIYSLGNTINEILPAAIGEPEAVTYTLTPTSTNGLTFSTATRAISGIPERPSRTEYTYTVEDSAIPVNTVSTNFFITIIAEAISSFSARGNGLISDIVIYNRVTPNLPLSIGTEFGSSVADLGDIDRNGTNDLAVGASLDDSGGSNRGAVYILLMNADNTIKANTKIIHGSAGIDLAGINLINDSNFGISVANIGDFDGNGINELAVGTLKGEIYILRLTDSGELSRFSKITYADLNDPIPVTSSTAELGSSIANLGDIDGDGVDDLAVGSIRDGSGGENRGAVHILFMDESGLTKKANATIRHPDVTLANFDAFGSSIAKLGDINGDGINDIAVGAIGDDTVNTNGGSVHVLLLNRDGSIKSDSFEIVDTNDNNIFNPDDQDFTGRSIANLGDINGDGINDIAVGAPGNTNNSKEGSVFTILMRNAGDDLITTNGFLRTADNSHPDLDLSVEDKFGQSIANIGDRNGDGVNDLAVGAPGTDSGGTDSGALYLLYMDAETVIRGITAAEENGRYEDGDTINIQVIFSEAVDVDATGGTPTLTLKTKDTDPEMNTDVLYVGGSGSDTLTFEYTVVTGDEATDLDYDSTASLTLSGSGTINATAAPNNAALLTLPEPGTRGSLSSNKNISINRGAITNTAPTLSQTIPDQVLTVNTSFTVTIPAGTFIDAENDPLTYSASGLPDGLTLDATGTFSGTPETEQVLTPYDYTVSDGTASTNSTISIKVNPAPTLRIIANISYSPDSLISETLPAADEGTGTKPIKYTLSPTLIDGLITFDAGERMIEGTAPTTEQTRQYTYTAEDANGALAAQTFTITISLIQNLNLRIKVFLEGAN